MYNYYQQQSYVPRQQQSTFPPPQQILKGHPVSGLEEVRATSVDFDGSVSYFPDLANKRIYTKTILMDGTAQLNMYELKPVPPDPGVADYVTRQEFDQALAKISELIKPQEQSQQPSNFKEVF